MEDTISDSHKVLINEIAKLVCAKSMDYFLAIAPRLHEDAYPHALIAFTDAFMLGYLFGFLDKSDEALESMSSYLGERVVESARNARYDEAAISAYQEAASMLNTLLQNAISEYGYLD